MASVMRDNHIIDPIAEILADINGLTAADLRTKSRKRTFTIPRQIAMYIIRDRYTPIVSLCELGLYFGRDHSTVIHACTFVDDMIRMKDKVITPMYDEAIYRLHVLETSVNASLDPYSHSALNLAAV
jgi:chromosomal replication initiation ATPase DnaA